MSRSGGRTTAEWTAFAGSCAVLLCVLALIAVELLGASTPAAPVAVASGAVRVIGGQSHVSVTVTNRGDETAANVQVSAELVVGDATTMADQTVDFLAGGEDVELVFVFAENPAEGVLTVEVTGFAKP